MICCVGKRSSQQKDNSKKKPKQHDKQQNQKPQTRIQPKKSARFNSGISNNELKALQEEHERKVKEFKRNFMQNAKENIIAVKDVLEVISSSESLEQIGRIVGVYCHFQSIKSYFYSTGVQTYKDKDTQLLLTSLRFAYQELVVSKIRQKQLVICVDSYIKHLKCLINSGPLPEEEELSYPNIFKKIHFDLFERMQELVDKATKKRMQSINQRQEEEELLLSQQILEQYQAIGKDTSEAIQILQPVYEANLKKRGTLEKIIEEDQSAERVGNSEDQSSRLSREELKEGQGISQNILSESQLITQNILSSQQQFKHADAAKQLDYTKEHTIRELNDRIKEYEGTLQILRTQIQEDQFKYTQITRSTSELESQKQSLEIAKNALEGEIKNLQNSNQILKDSLRLTKDELADLKEQIERQRGRPGRKDITLTELQFKTYFAGEVLEKRKAEKQFLTNSIETHMRREIEKTRVLYDYRRDKKVNFHEFADGHSNLVLIVETENALVASYYSGELQPNTPMEDEALIVSLDSRKVYRLNNLRNYPNKDPRDRRIIRGMVYDQYYLIFGNAEVRVRAGENKVFSNFGINNSYFNSERDRVSDLLKQGTTNEIEFINYEIHEVMFKQEFQQQEYNLRE